MIKASPTLLQVTNAASKLADWQTWTHHCTTPCPWFNMREVRELISTCSMWRHNLWNAWNMDHNYFYQKAKIKMLHVFNQEISRIVFGCKSFNYQILGMVLSICWKIVLISYKIIFFIRDYISYIIDKC